MPYWGLVLRLDCATGFSENFWEILLGLLSINLEREEVYGVLSRLRAMCTGCETVQNAFVFGSACYQHLIDDITSRLTDIVCFLEDVSIPFISYILRKNSPLKHTS